MYSTYCEIHNLEKVLCPVCLMEALKSLHKINITDKQYETLKEAWELMWDNITNDQKQEFLNLPNFDAKIFEEITGIKI